MQAYYASDDARRSGAYEVSQLVWALFLVLNVVFTYASREAVRELLERRWRAGIGLKRILIAGAGDLGRMVADRMLQHRELGYQVVGFVDDRAGGDHIGYRGLPLLGTLAEVAEIAQRERIDHLYVALPLEEHAKLLDLMEITSRECIDVKVVPDLLQFIALRARLEDLDGLPIINVNDVPLQGFNAWVKRGARRRALGGRRWSSLAIPFADHRAARAVDVARPDLLRAGTHGPRRQGVHRLQVPLDAPGRRGRHRPRVGARRRPAHDADRAAGCAASISTSCRSSGTCSRATCRSSARARSGRSSSSSSSTASRSTCCATRSRPGITGWAQVNGWRGNTSLEKRIEYDLYYIENWSVTLDLKIMWLTARPGLCSSERLTGTLWHASSSPAPPASSDPISAKRCSTAATRSSASTISLTGDLDNIAHLRDRDFEFIRHDVTQYIDVDGPVDYVLHWASPASPIDYLELPIQTLKVGSLGTHNALGLAKAKKARFVHRLDVGGLRRSARAPAEGNLLGQRQPDRPARRLRRGQAVRRGDHARLSPLPRRRTRRSSASSTPTVRACGCATAAPCRRSCRRRCSNEDVTVFGDGTQTRSFCYVTDLVDGIIRLMESNTNEPVNIGNPHEVTIEEIARTIITLVGSTSQIVYRPLPVDDPKQRQPDITRARTMLGLGAEGRPRRGPAKTVEYFKNAGDVSRHLALRPSPR